MERSEGAETKQTRVSLEKHRGKEFVELVVPFTEVSVHKFSVGGQMRTTFDQDKLYELRDAIASTEQLESVTACLMSEDLAREYLKFSNDMFGRKRIFDDFIPYDSSGGQTDYLVMIDGERRLRSMKMIEEYDRDEKLVHTSLRRVTSADGFQYLLAMQVSANIQEIPDSYDFAAYARVLYQTGDYESVADFAETQSGAIGEKRTREAMLFFAMLPASVRKNVEAGELAYTTSVELARHRRDFAAATYEKLLSVHVEENYPDNEDISLSKKELYDLRRQAMRLAGADVIFKTTYVLQESITADRVRALRGKWLAEIHYDQLDFFERAQESEKVSLNVLERRVLKASRGPLNSSSRLTEAHKIGMTSLLGTLGMNGEKFAAGTRDNLIRSLRSLTGYLERLMAHYPDDPELQEEGDYLLELFERHDDLIEELMLSTTA